MNQDREHLRILSILHYVYAGLIALASLIGLLYVFIGTMFIATPPRASGGGPPPPPQFGWFFICIGGSFMVVGWVVAVLVALSGKYLAAHKNWIFSFVIACLICLNMPLGTLLGVFTIVVLLRPTVKEMFEATPARLADVPPERPYYPPDDPSYRPG